MNRAAKIEEAARALRDASLTVMWSRRHDRCIYCGSPMGEGHRAEPPYRCGLAVALEAVDFALALPPDGDEYRSGILRALSEVLDAHDAQRRDLQARNTELVLSNRFLNEELRELTEDHAILARQLAKLLKRSADAATDPMDGE